MFGIDRKRQAVEETPALRRRAGEQRVHCRHQPDRSQMISEGRCRPYRFAIDPAAALVERAILGRTLNSGAERHQSQRAFDLGSHGPRAVAFVKRYFTKRRPPQTAPLGPTSTIVAASASSEAEW